MQSKFWDVPHSPIRRLFSVGKHINFVGGTQRLTCFIYHHWKPLRRRVDVRYKCPEIMLVWSYRLGSLLWLGLFYFISFATSMTLHNKKTIQLIL